MAVRTVDKFTRESLLTKSEKILKRVAQKTHFQEGKLFFLQNKVKLMRFQSEEAEQVS